MAHSGHSVCMHKGVKDWVKNEDDCPCSVAWDTVGYSTGLCNSMLQCSDVATAWVMRMHSGMTCTADSECQASTSTASKHASHAMLFTHANTAGRIRKQLYDSTWATEQWLLTLHVRLHAATLAFTDIPVPCT